MIVLNAVLNVGHFSVTTVLTTLLSPLVIAAVGTCVITVLTTLTFDNTRVTIKIKINDMSIFFYQQVDTRVAQVPKSVAFFFWNFWMYVTIETLLHNSMSWCTLGLNTL